MRIEGEAAKGRCAVRLDSFMNVNQGELLLADEDTGEVKWKDRAGVETSVTLGPHAIRILRSR